MTETRRRSRKGEGELLRDEIINAANALLLEAKSQDAVSIRAVAQYVGVTSPSIYRHFEDKDALLLAVCEKQFDELEQTLAVACEHASSSREAIELRARAYIRFGLTRPELYRFMFFSECHIKPDEDDVLLGNSSLQSAALLVRDVLGGESIPEEYAALRTLALWTGLHGVVAFALQDPLSTSEDFEQSPLVETVLGLHLGTA